MPRGNPRNWARQGGFNETEPLAVPLRDAAKLLDTPAAKLRRLGVKPYTRADGVKVYSLSQLRRAMGLESAKREYNMLPRATNYPVRAKIRT